MLFWILAHTKILALFHKAQLDKAFIIFISTFYESVKLRYLLYTFNCSQVADDGLQQSVEEELSPPAPTTRQVHESTSYQDISVPVYATVKGVS